MYHITRRKILTPESHQNMMIEVFRKQGIIYNRWGKWVTEACGGTPMIVYNWLLSNIKPGMYPDDIALKWTIAPIHSLHEIIFTYGDMALFYHYRNHIPVYKDQRLVQKVKATEPIAQLESQTQHTESIIDSDDDHAIDAIVMDVIDVENHPCDAIIVEKPAQEKPAKKKVIKKPSKTRKRSIKKSVREPAFKPTTSGSIYTRTRRNLKTNDIVDFSGLVACSGHSSDKSTPGITSQVLNHTTKQGRLHPLVRQHLPQIVNMSLARTGRHPGIWLLPGKKRINK